MYDRVQRCLLGSVSNLKLRRKDGRATRSEKKSERTTEKPNRSSKLTAWDDVSMLQAMQAVKEGRMGVNCAALEHGVPKSTMKDRISGRVKNGSRSGPPSYLSEDMEKELVTLLIEASRKGYGKTKREVLAILRNTISKKGQCVEEFWGKGWWHRFMQQHPTLSLRTADPLSQARADALTEKVMQSYFKETLEKHDLLNKPALIYNVDETGMPLDPRQLKRVAKKGAKKVHGRTSGNKSQITVAACSSATGHTNTPHGDFQRRAL